MVVLNQEQFFSLGKFGDIFVYYNCRQVVYYGHLSSTGAAKYPIMLRTVLHNRELTGPNYP